MQDDKAARHFLDYRGVSLAGAEFGQGSLPGTYGRDYIYPEAGSTAYFAGKGMNLIRLPFRWERLQPQLNQPFDVEELKRLKSFVSEVTASGMYVLLDPHNFARYRDDVIGSPSLPAAAFGDLWSRLAKEFKANPKVMFGLVNEPHDMSTEDWVAAANEAIRAIRATGAANTITVPGNAWSGAHSWSRDYYGTPNAEAMLKVKDSGNNMVIEVHQYLDSDSSGSSQECVDPKIGVDRLSGFTAWLKKYHKRALLGELGAADNKVCREALTAMLDHLHANADVWTGFAWWAAGPWWNDYFLSIEPAAHGKDKPQMDVLAPYLPRKKDPSGTR